MNKRDEVVLEEFRRRFTVEKYARYGGYYKGLDQRKGTVEELEYWLLQKLQEERAVAQNELLEVLMKNVRKMKYREVDGGYVNNTPGLATSVLSVESANSVLDDVLDLLNQHKK